MIGTMAGGMRAKGGRGEGKVQKRLKHQLAPFALNYIDQLFTKNVAKSQSLVCAFRSPKNECISLVWLVLPTSVQNSLGDSRTDNITEYLTVQSTEQVAVSTVLPVARHEAGGIPILTSATMGTSHNTGSSSLGGDGHSAGMPGRNQASLRRSSRCTYPDQNRASCDVPRAYNSYDRHVAMSQRIWPSISAMHTAYTKSLVGEKTVQAL